MKRLLAGLGRGRGGGGPDKPVVDDSETVHISSLALLKMLKHSRAGVPMEVMGLMLGEYVDDYTVRVLDCFAMPQSGTGFFFFLFFFFIFLFYFFVFIYFVVLESLFISHFISHFFFYLLLLFFIFIFIFFIHSFFIHFPPIFQVSVSKLLTPLTNHKCVKC